MKRVPINQDEFHTILLKINNFNSMKRTISLMLALVCINMANAQSLAEKLGYKKTDRLLIVNCDDAGMCKAANQAATKGQLNGLISSATIMMPCPEADKMTKSAINNNLDVGVHLTHTSEWETYRWSPVLPRHKVKGLVDKSGNLWKSVEEVYKNSTPVEAYNEGKAQIQKALDAGLEITHIDSHMGTMQLSPPYIDAYLQLAVDFNLPARMASQETLEKYGQPFIRKKFEQKGILSPDYLVYEELDNYSQGNIKSFWENIIKNLKPGVTELYIHASVPDEELKTITNSWKMRNAEYELFTNNKEFREFIEKEGIILIGYKPILELQQKDRK